jgi:ABC-2 type transport system ATP-binding protein
MEAAVIEADGLCRTFRIRTGWFRPVRREVMAVRHVSLSVRRGELFGMLGPNGAGKTTTIKMLNTLLLPTAGTARVCGYDVASQSRAVRQRVGYVFGGDRGLYDRLSGLDNLRYFAELYGVDAGRQRRRIAELLDLVGLAGRERERVQGYSRGMRQRLHIARGLLHSPEVLFLDEPSIGLDPVGARELRAMVKDLAASGTTVLLTTHYMAEAEELCNRIAVIAAGRIRALGSAHQLMHSADGRRVLNVEALGATEDQLARIRALPGVRSVTAEDHGLRRTISVQSDGATDIQQLTLMQLDGVRVTRVETRAPSLEDAYVAIVNGAGSDAYQEVPA